MVTNSVQDACAKSICKVSLFLFFHVPPQGGFLRSLAARGFSGLRAPRFCGPGRPGPGLHVGLHAPRSPGPVRPAFSRGYAPGPGRFLPQGTLSPCRAHLVLALRANSPCRTRGYFSND